VFSPNTPFPFGGLRPVARSLRTSRSPLQRPRGCIRPIAGRLPEKQRGPGDPKGSSQRNQLDSQGSTPSLRKKPGSEPQLLHFLVRATGSEGRPGPRLPENQEVPGVQKALASGINWIARGRPPLSEKLPGLRCPASSSRCSSALCASCRIVGARRESDETLCLLQGASLACDGVG